MKSFFDKQKEKQEIFQHLVLSEKNVFFDTTKKLGLYEQIDETLSDKELFKKTFIKLEKLAKFSELKRELQV